MGAEKKKISFLRKAKMTAAIKYNTIMIMAVRVLLAKHLPHQKLHTTDLTGKLAIVTGSNTGLGKAIALYFAQMNATVYMVCRNMKKAEAARDDILKSVPKADLHLLQLDTSTLENCNKFCSDWAANGGKTIDILFHNAGLGCPPSADHPFSAEGFEYMYMTNFLSNVALTHGLERFFAPNASMVMVASPGVYIGGFSDNFANQSTKDVMEPGFNFPANTGPNPPNSTIYSATKTMQVCFAKNLMKKWKAEGKNYVAHAFTPGYAASDFFEKEGVKTAGRKDDAIWWFLTKFKAPMPAEEGCKTGVMLAINKTKKVTDKAGYLWDRMKWRTSTVDLMSDELLEKLWDRWCNDAGVHWSLHPDTSTIVSKGSVDEIITEK